MRMKKPILIALFLCAWSIISYLLLIRQSDTTSNRYVARKSIESLEQSEIIRQLDRLEANIQEENLLHDELVKKLLEIVKLNDQQNHVGGENAAALFEKYTVIDPNVASNSKSSKANQISNVIDGNSAHNGPINQNSDIGDNEIPASGYDNQKQLLERLKQLNKPSADFHGPIIPVLVFACNRISVRNCIDNLLEYRPNANQFPIIVSQVSNISFDVSVYSIVKSSHIFNILKGQNKLHDTWKLQFREPAVHRFD